MRIAENIRWAPSYAEALEEARRRKVPLHAQGAWPGHDAGPGLVPRRLRHAGVRVQRPRHRRAPEREVREREVQHVALGSRHRRRPARPHLQARRHPLPGPTRPRPGRERARQDDLLGHPRHVDGAAAEGPPRPSRPRRRRSLVPGPSTWTCPPSARSWSCRPRFKTGDKEARRALVPAFRTWLDQYAASNPDAAAIARCLLGDSLYCIGEFKQADEMWH